jgi:nitroimidazol reductase NimA-like FMN-containing flavoprotein (pyridoxamine 5'-phosphate oxidase superfamily)
VLTTNSAAVLAELDEATCLRLISPGGVGRVAFVGRFGLTVLPVNYRLADGAILFRTAPDGATAEDLRTGIAHADYKVAFEIDAFDEVSRQGWSVLVQGPAHHLDCDPQRAAARTADVQPWPGGERDQFIRIMPDRITGRRVRQG